jgi:peptidoglycan-associated lipoprotein
LYFFILCRIKRLYKKGGIIIMKKNLTGMAIFVLLIFGMTIFTGCADKKSVVKSDTPQMQETAPTPTPQDTATKDSSTESSKIKDSAVEQSSLMGPTAKSPLSDINFDYDSSAIGPDARKILSVNADFLSKNKVSAIVVEGHCDERGTAEYNMALGQRRAQETKNYLVNLGVNESKITTMSYGEERPLDTGNNEEAWAKNRRAHFVVTP